MYPRVNWGWGLALSIVTDRADGKFRSRKWILSVGIQVIASVALFNGNIDGQAWASVSSANVAAYSFAQAAEYFKRND